jgi:hypothetical protein
MHFDVDYSHACALYVYKLLMLQICKCWLRLEHSPCPHQILHFLLSLLNTQPSGLYAHKNLLPIKPKMSPGRWTRSSDGKCCGCSGMELPKAGSRKMSFVTFSSRLTSMCVQMHHLMIFWTSLVICTTSEMRLSLPLPLPQNLRQY